MEDIGRLLTESLEAIHKQNTRRGIRCMCGCGITFLTAREYFHHVHPSRTRRG